MTVTLTDLIGIETFCGPGAGAPRRSPATLTLRVRGVVDTWQASHVLAAICASHVRGQGCAKAYVDTSTGDVLVEATTEMQAMDARRRAADAPLRTMLALALGAMGVHS